MKKTGLLLIASLLLAGSLAAGEALAAENAGEEQGSLEGMESIEGVDIEGSYGGHIDYEMAAMGGLWFELPKSLTGQDGDVSMPVSIYDGEGYCLMAGSFATPGAAGAFATEQRGYLDSLDDILNKVEGYEIMIAEENAYPNGYIYRNKDAILEVGEKAYEILSLTAFCGEEAALFHIGFDAEADYDTMMLCQEIILHIEETLGLYGEEPFALQGGQGQPGTADHDTFTDEDENLADGTLILQPPTEKGLEGAVAWATYYLSITPFSYKALVEQLEEYEGFTHEEAVYGVEHAGADFSEQAAYSAASYKEAFPDMTTEDIIEQLEYEGYTKEEAAYGGSSIEN